MSDIDVLIVFHTIAIVMYNMLAWIPQ